MTMFARSKAVVALLFLLFTVSTAETTTSRGSLRGRLNTEASAESTPIEAARALEQSEDAEAVQSSDEDDVDEEEVVDVVEIAAKVEEFVDLLEEVYHAEAVAHDQTKQTFDNLGLEEDTSQEVIDMAIETEDELSEIADTRLNTEVATDATPVGAARALEQVENSEVEQDPDGVAVEVEFQVLEAQNELSMAHVHTEQTLDELEPGDNGAEEEYAEAVQTEEELNILLDRIEIAYEDIQAQVVVAMVEIDAEHIEASEDTDGANI